MSRNFLDYWGPLAEYKGYVWARSIGLLQASKNTEEVSHGLAHGRPSRAREKVLLKALAQANQRLAACRAAFEEFTANHYAPRRK